MQVSPAPDVELIMNRILMVLNEEYGHVNVHRIICMRSTGCKARAYARIWNLPDIWQKALELSGPFYIIEVLSQHFDKLDEEGKERVIIHELLHVPKSFSGALVPHTCFGKKINEKAVAKIHQVYKERVRQGARG